MEKIRNKNVENKKLRPINIKVQTKRGKTVVVHFGRSEQLGEQIIHFSLPRILTCVGYTPWCYRNCYARYGRHIYPSVRKARFENWKLAERKDFEKIMVKAIEKIYSKGFKVLRLHEEGDFYSVSYIQKWINIIRKLREKGIDIFIYAYTRAWRIPTLLPLLEEMRKLPNVRLIASTDPLTGPAPSDWIEAGINFCYQTPAIMCLSDQGKVPNCSQCRVCINGRVNIYFHVPKAEL
jgi:hypothetical protein